MTAAFVLLKVEKMTSLIHLNAEIYALLWTSALKLKKSLLNSVNLTPCHREKISDKNDYCNG